MLEATRSAVVAVFFILVVPVRSCFLDSELLYQCPAVFLIVGIRASHNSMQLLKLRTNCEDLSSN